MHRIVRLIGPEEEFNKGVLVPSCAFSFSLENSFLCQHAIIMFYTSQVSPTCAKVAWHPTKIIWRAPFVVVQQHISKLVKSTTLSLANINHKYSHAFLPFNETQWENNHLVGPQTLPIPFIYKQCFHSFGTEEHMPTRPPSWYQQ